MFSKAKLKRFNDEVGCAPPPTAYNPKSKSGNSAAVSLDKSDRWKQNKEITPGPGTYTGELITSPTKQQKSTSSSKLNSSTCSSSSITSGNGVFLSPPKPARLSRSNSMRSVRGRQADRDPRVTDLEEQIKTLTQERDKLKQLISRLEKQLEDLQKKITTGEGAEDAEKLKRERDLAELESARFTLDDNEAQMESLNSTISVLSLQNEKLRSLIETEGKSSEEVIELQDELELTRTQLKESQQLISYLTDERSGLQLKLQKLEESSKTNSMTEDELQSLRDHVDHLTVLRDNLESTARIKDDLIAELQVQLDEVVVEGRTYHEQMEAYRSKMEQLDEEVQISFRERDEATSKVRNLIAKYETLMKDHIEEREITREMLAKKDIEIELLNASLSNLSMKASDYESELNQLRACKEDRLSKISILETTISDLSMKTKEKEMMESILGEELNQRTDEVKGLEENVKKIEKQLSEIRDEKDLVLAKLEEEKNNTAELSRKINTLEMHIKEKEVVQQFLEKEIASREAEVSESSTKIKELEEDLSTARQVAMDLQQDAEAKMDEVLHLKATISGKDYDCETKDELLTSLREEKGSVDKELASVRAALVIREEGLATVESKMVVLEENNKQLEEKVVELMAEISDREAEHIVRIKTIESDLEDIGVKYSESLLEHEATRRVLTQTLEQMEREKLLRQGTEADMDKAKEDMDKLKADKETVETNMRDLVQKYTSLEDALACEEAENRDLEERLEREASGAKEAAAKAEKELTTLKTSSDGFCTQITQLKIDMRKKSQAVEEMQQCIDTLREEKFHLTTLRDNLEKTLENKEESIAKLHLEGLTIEREMEEERVAFRSKIADLENHLKETESEKETGTLKIKELETRLSSLEEENLCLTKSYEKQLEEITVAETGANARLEELQKKYEGYEDQVINLQTSLSEKTAEILATKEKYDTANKKLDTFQEETKVLETSVKRFKREIEAMNKTLASKDSSLDSLNMSLNAKSEEVQSLYKTLEDKQSALVENERRVQDLEEKEEKLNKETEKLNITISSLQEEYNQVKSHYSRLETTFREEKYAEISRATSALETDVDVLKSVKQTLEEEVKSWKSKFEYLEKMIEPFREQLDAYEVEKASLLSRSSAAKEEVDKMSKQYATLLGHQNHKQKIQHVLKLKTENNTLREDVHKLRQETERQRKTIWRLEERMVKISGSTTRVNETTRSMDKENSFYGGMGNQAVSSTPLKPSNRPHRI